ncbi:Ccr4p-Not complex 3'-5'-exoribonuclease subunit Ccr4 [Diutina catenulata]
MNVNSKYGGPTPTLQDQQILLQQLQGQQQQQQPPQPGNEYEIYQHPSQSQRSQQQQFMPMQLHQQHQQPPQQPQQQQPQQQQMRPPSFYRITVENPQSIFWQHQQQLANISRNNNIPHYYARQFASNSRKKNPYSTDKSVSLVDATKSAVAAIDEQEEASSVSAPNPALLQHKKSVQADEEQRMRQKNEGRQLWCQLDLGGQGLMNLSPKLFHYNFLESLYLNNNKLTTVPPAIKKLKSLRVLDLSHNRITEVPPELGLCFNLRYLYLFDNQIKSLPNEFGNLIELLFLGIEGNPLDMKFANIVAENGTKDLIQYLRDQRPNFGPPAPRPWLLLEDEEMVDPKNNHDKPQHEDPNSFTMTSFNTLCQHYATPKMFKYTPSWALNWEFRRNQLKDEVLQYSSDLICLQEVEARTYLEFWTPLMAEMGYKGVFFNKTRSKTMNESDSKKVDGCATFYNTSKFRLLKTHNFEYNSVCMRSDKYKKTKDLFNRFMNKDNIALIAYLEHEASGEKIVVVNTHLHWDPAFNDVKALQVGILLEELQGMLKEFHRTNSLEEVKQSSLIVCGDFNSVRDSAVYQLFSTGGVTKHDDLEGRDYGSFTDDGFRHPFKLKSAYGCIGELPFTNFSPGFTDVIDYVWYSTPTLEVEGLLGKVDENYSSRCIGFPNADFPSDHIPLVTRFKIKKSTPPSKRPDFKPDFKTSRKT